MPFKLYNTLTRRKDEFSPLNPPYVGMYVCGPTVYGHSHLGHARSYITPDVLYRYLTFLGYKVKYVQNITDVGHLVGDADEGADKIQKQAHLENVDPVAIAYKYETSYFEDMDRLNILRPTISCRATGHIIEMITFIQKLIETGHAYVTDAGNVYYSVESFPGYGKLSGRTTEEAKEGERVAVADDKHAPADFALWKKADGGHIMKWPSPWGMGYPGWHIECSVMSTKYLGDTFDIHCGGMENAFPHHECEIAQAEAVTGKEFVRFFVHHNMLTVNGTKMGKSLGNFIILKDLYKKMDPIALRFYILQGHYRSPLDFTDASLSAGTAGFDRMRNSVLAMRNALAGKDIAHNDEYEDVNKLRQDFLAAMDDDMNTPIAISVLYDILKISNTELGKSDCDYTKVDYVDSTIKTLAEDILGLKFDGAGSGGGDNMTDKLMKLLIGIRNDARKQKNFAVSDKIRDELDEIGIVLKDGVNGTSYAKNKLCLLLLLLTVTFSGYALGYDSGYDERSFAAVTDKRVFGYGTFVDLYIPFGIGYVANISTAMTRMEQLVGLHVPTGVCADIRFFAQFSIFSGVEFLYEFLSFRQSSDNDDDSSIRHLYHNLQFEIPLVVKFYPFVSKGDMYENMYLGAGLLAHFSAARFYGIDNGSDVVYGNVYTDGNKQMIPSSAYPPVNVGIRLVLGNTFMFRDKAGFGMELYLNYLFVPTVCGYWTDPAYTVAGEPYLDFSLTVGIAFSAAIRAYSSLRD